MHSGIIDTCLKYHLINKFVPPNIPKKNVAANEKIRIIKNLRNYTYQFMLTVAIYNFTKCMIFNNLKVTDKWRLLAFQITGNLSRFEYVEL